MPRDIDKENQEIMNGNRFVVNPEESTGVFHRDVDKLFWQYKHLRLKVYKQYKEYLPDPISQSELKSYIDEQFVRLVKEYDINSPVDFPGYVKKKLNQRVKNSYIKGAYRDRSRVFVTRNDFDVAEMMEQSPKEDEELDYYEVLEYVLSKVKLTDLEKLILMYILQELTDSQIEKRILNNQEGERHSLSTIRETIREMQTFLKEKLRKSLEM